VISVKRKEQLGTYQFSENWTSTRSIFTGYHMTDRTYPTDGDRLTDPVQNVEGHSFIRKGVSNVSVGTRNARRGNRNEI